MRIGVIKEIKNQEQRVALSPLGARALAERGHHVAVQAQAGSGAGFPDDAYRAAGAHIVSREDAWAAELVLKVKEPLETEYHFLGDQILFTYLHLAGASPALTEALVAAGTTAVAYETLEDAAGRLPLLAPMSAVAGNMAISMGICYLARPHQGKGALLGSLFGRRYGKAVIVGDGVVGQHAGRAANGLGAHVVLFGRHREREAELKRAIAPDIQFVLSTPENLGEHLKDADLVVGAVLSRGARAPHVITEIMVASMQPGSVIVDVSIDQGGCVATSRPTSHTDPVFIRHEVIHYCVTNMPGAYPRTATMALTEATLPYALRLADGGIDAARADPGFAKGVNTYQGQITCQAVAIALGMTSHYHPFRARE